MTRWPLSSRPGWPTRPLAEMAKVFDGYGVCWGPYQTFTPTGGGATGAAARPIRCSKTSTSRVSGPCGRRGPRSPFGPRPARRRCPAPLLGQHTDEILSEELGLSPSEIGALHDAGIVAGPEDAG